MYVLTKGGVRCLLLLLFQERVKSSRDLRGQHWTWKFTVLRSLRKRGLSAEGCQLIQPTGAISVSLPLLSFPLTLFIRWVGFGTAKLRGRVVLLTVVSCSLACSVTA